MSEGTFSDVATHLLNMQSLIFMALQFYDVTKRQIQAEKSHR